MYFAHRLVAKYFIDNPGNLPYVHHKDENRLNNNVSNLAWTTPKENYHAHRVKNSPQKRRPAQYVTENLPDEEWKVFPLNTKCCVFTYGRVKNNKNNRLIYPDSTQVYVRVCLNDKKHYSLNRMVYCTFHDNFDMEGYVIDHIYCNPKNNKLENLQKITQSENTLRQNRKGSTTNH